MENTAQMLSAPLLEPSEETELAKRVEAGLYAERLLTSRDRRHPEADLDAVAAAGRRAWVRLFESNLRLVMKLALSVAYRQRCDVDDLFQEGCLALGEALRRFDYRRGLRLSTYVHDWLTHHLARMAATSCGLRDIRRGTDGVRRVIPVLGLNHAPAASTSWEAPFEEVERTSMDFLELLGSDAKVLKLRFASGPKEVPRSRVGARLGLSPSTVKRIEERALARARQLLSADCCRVAG